jgi:hypothetical protein
MLDGRTKPLPPDPKNILFGKRLHRGAVEKSKAKNVSGPQLAPAELVVRGNLFTK